MLLYPTPTEAAKSCKGLLVIPDIGMELCVNDSPIVDRQHVVGPEANHFEGTSWIYDGWGKVVIGGHNPGDFSPLLDVQKGSRVYVVGTGEVVVYQITHMRLVEISEVGELAPTTEPTLMLQTCVGNQRLLVYAERV